MTDTTDSTVRLLRLLTLLQQHAVWTGPELADRLDVPVSVDRDIPGVGITGVVLGSVDDEIRVTRTDGNLATFSAPGLPQRLVALPRRDLNTLLAEELRRMDDDPIYAEAMAALVRRLDKAADRGRGRPA